MAELLPPWTAQDAQLRTWYGRRLVRDIARDLGRSPQAVKARAHVLRLKTRPAWTLAQLSFLRTHYHEFTCEQLADVLGHTPASVKQQAFREGITVPNRNWTPEEVEYLRAHYADMTAAELGEALGLSDRQVWTKASALGLRKVRLLSREAREILWEMRDTAGVIAFFSREFGVGEPALRRLLEAFREAGGPFGESEPLPL